MENETEQSIKEKALQMIERLPDDCTWDDLMYHIYVCKSIEDGLQDSREGRLIPQEKILKEFGINDNSTLR